MIDWYMAVFLIAVIVIVMHKVYEDWSKRRRYEAFSHFLVREFPEFSARITWRLCKAAIEKCESHSGVWGSWTYDGNEEAKREYGTWCANNIASLFSKEFEDSALKDPQKFYDTIDMCLTQSKTASEDVRVEESLLIRFYYPIITGLICGVLAVSKPTAYEIKEQKIITLFLNNLDPSDAEVVGLETRDFVIFNMSKGYLMGRDEKRTCVDAIGFRVCFDYKSWRPWEKS